jgi:short-subunit dehydrogenase
LGAHSCYSGSKAFLSTFLESLRVDVHGTGVRVTCIEPGFVKSEMSDRLEGHAPMPFRATAEAAAEKYGRAILRGARVISWPTVHAVASAAVRWVPKPIFDPLSKSIAKAQVAMVEAERKAPHATEPENKART